jgi:putative glycosyltransferase (TIGR04372 family)
MMGAWRAEDVPLLRASPHAQGGRTTASNSDLRLFNRQAIDALNTVDIAGCIRNAMPGATTSCMDGEIEKLCIKEEACHYLAVALIQGLGRMDDAVLWWRERKRATTAIARHLLERDCCVHDMRNRIFDQFWSSHIGHTAMLGIHVKRNLLEGRPYRLWLLRAPEPNPGNRYLVDLWQKYFTLAERPIELPFPVDGLRYGCKDLFLEERLSGPETYFWQAYAEISRAWEQAGGGPLFELSNHDIELGEEALSAMGIPAGAWYVCLHVRSAGYKAIHEGLQDALNADITTYDLAIDAIVERGGWVIRMGDPSMPKLPARNGVVDYAHSPQKTERTDIFLCATCRFYIGTSSGLAYVPNLFGVPCVFTNWFPTATRPLNSSDLFIPKLHWHDSENDFVPFADSLAPPLGHIHAKSTLRTLSISLKDNTAEDVRDVVIEMLDRLESSATNTAEDENLRVRFDAVATNSRSFGNASIGRDFLRKYRRLLPTGEPCSKEGTEQISQAPRTGAEKIGTNRARLIAARTQASIWLSRNLLYYPRLRLNVSGSFVPSARDVIDPGLVSRITTAYKLAMNHFKGPGDSVWSGFSERSRDIHQSLLAGSDECITQILEDPIPTNLFDGYYSVVRDLDLDEGSHEARKLREWAVHQIFECLVRLAQAIGATRLWNPERTEPEPDGKTSVTPRSVEDLLAELDREIGLRIDFPNPIQREFGLPTSRGIASYRAPHAIYQAWRTRKLLGEVTNASVLEIGAGMGRTAYYARHLGITDFTIVDLPLANVAQANFLGRVLGPEAIWLLGDPVSEQAGRIRICPPEWLATTDQEFDVVLNVDSITEMDSQHAINYVREISRRARMFLSINHEANPFSVRDLLSKCNIKARTLRYPYWLRKGYLEEILFF